MMDWPPPVPASTTRDPTPGPLPVPRMQDAIHNAIVQGRLAESRPVSTERRGYPCYVVRRAIVDSKAHFQVPVSGARVLAQKVIVRISTPGPTDSALTSRAPI